MHIELDTNVSKQVYQSVVHVRFAGSDECRSVAISAMKTSLAKRI